MSLMRSLPLSYETGGTMQVIKCGGLSLNSKDKRKFGNQQVFSGLFRSDYFWQKKTKSSWFCLQ